MTKEFKIELGEYLSRRRIQKGFTQAQVAKFCGYTSAQFISNCERGIAPLPIPTLRKLVKYPDLSPDEVVSIFIAASKIELMMKLGTLKPQRRRRSRP